ncbi:hypothetical protein MAR_025542 [Mya arenaria]|uniref:Uncharacterized protein n=1 Tax=Mya arenaria TaxID=6604 RepID=A0ABY7EMY5_MYAAR|nr:hypothetical protein MAR_025542 [Mya arenaria]
MDKAAANINGTILHAAFTLPHFKNTVTFTASDSKRDKCTNTAPVNIQNNSFYQTGNLPRQITIAEKCAVIITKNIDTADHLVSDTIGIVERKLVHEEDCLSSIHYIFILFLQKSVQSQWNLLPSHVTNHKAAPMNIELQI